MSNDNQQQQPAARAEINAPEGDYFTPRFSSAKAWDGGGVSAGARVDNKTFKAWLDAHTDAEGLVAFKLNSKRTASPSNQCYIQNDPFRPVKKQQEQAPAAAPDKSDIPF